MAATEPFTNVPTAEPQVPTPEVLRDLRELQVGFGGVVWRADRQGMWLGSQKFADAPFSVDMAGNVIARSATIAGYKLFEAVVGPSGADYTTVAAALNAGKTRIFVRNGTYTSEPKWVITADNTLIQGESKGGVAITFAQDTVNARSIYWNASRPIFINLKLTSYESGQQTLFEAGSSGYYPVVSNCILRNRRGKVFDGAALSALHGTFVDTYIDFLGVLDATLMKAFYGISNSYIANVFVDMDFAASGCSVVDSCSNSRFLGCSMRMAQANEWNITSSPTCFFVGCDFYVYQLKPDANFDSCYFENNGNSPSGYMIDITTSTVRFVGNRVKLDKSYNLLRCGSANVQIHNNYFDGGKKIICDPGVTIYGSSFCDNMWVSAYTTAAIDAQFGNNTNKWNILGNIFRCNDGAGSTPTITNTGTANNNVNNQLILG